MGIPKSSLATGLPLLAWQVAFFLGAIAFLVWMTFWSIQNYIPRPDLSPDNWRSLLQSKLFYEIYFRTVLQSALAATLAVIIAFPAAYGLTAGTSPRVVRVSMMLLIIPFFTSYLIRAYAWRFLLEREGPINYILSLLHMPQIVFQGTIAAVIIGYFAYYLPLIILIQMIGLMNIPIQYSEAAHNLGAARLRTVRTVVVPLAKPAIVSSFLFAFMMSMGDFVSPSLIGGGAKPTLSILIVNTIQGQSNFPKAACIAIVMLLTMTAVFLVANAIFLAKKESAHG